MQSDVERGNVWRHDQALYKTGVGEKVKQRHTATPMMCLMMDLTKA
jgi:hypothetical protein